MLRYAGPLVGLKGEVFNLNGRIAGSIPPVWMPDAIQFHILGEYAGQTPRWLDILVDGEKCRINPEICEPPWSRLFDCVAMAKSRRHAFARSEQGTASTIWLPPKPHPDAREFAFVLAFHGQLVLIDTLERMRQFSV